MQVTLEQLRNRWRVLRLESRGERQRLERLLNLWREYETGMDELVDWLITILSLVKSEEICNDSFNMLQGQLEHLKVKTLSESCVSSSVLAAVVYLCVLTVSSYCLCYCFCFFFLSLSLSLSFSSLLTL